MSLTFYYSPMSSSGITEAVLDELQIPCERIKVDLKAGDARKPEYLALNPNGKVPMIVHEETPIWESVAITMYLGEMFGVEKQLYPAPGPKRGEAMKWIVWANVTLGQPVYQLFGLQKSDNEAAKKKAQDELAVALKVFEVGLEGRQFLLGEEYSLADTHLLSVVGLMMMLNVDLTPYPNVTGWMKHGMERPAFAKK
eukprot:TRINITY_DN9561_c0_g3_i1.p1 TRINITY_DN9561_c0_g3~~TRINITY_DN9561_c0_g3_i1.p1  ORF type:complete len:197 (-),score=35.01 TRINITY_DN9561_c0_g3_i1:178-768(-)